LRLYRQRRARRSYRACAIIRPEFRIGSDHPPLPHYPPNNRRMSARLGCGNVKFPRIFPTRKLQENTKSCRDCGGGHRLFAMTQSAQQPLTVVKVL
jgi:hypothetical protein